MRGLVIRDEGPDDAAAIRALVTAAFRSAPHASGTEGAIVDRLRDAGALTLSLVAQDGADSPDPAGRAGAGKAGPARSEGPLPAGRSDGPPPAPSRHPDSLPAAGAGDGIPGMSEEPGPAAPLLPPAGGGILGHLAASPVRIGEAPGWFGIGPLAVRPDRQSQGIGAALMRAALARLRAGGAAGVVLVGDPGYYGRFGFGADPRVAVPGIPAPFVLVLPFGPAAAAGQIRFHPAFGLDDS